MTPTPRRITHANEAKWIELFLCVADWADGVPIEESGDHILGAYNRIFNTPEGQRIYGEAVDNNPFNELIK